MIQLIKLEWKKNKISASIRNAMIMSALVGMFLFAQCYLGIANDAETGVPDAAPGTYNISSQVELLTSASYLVFTGVMLASFIIGAYKNKTMSLMFLYPVRRRNILAAKMLAVWIFNFLALILTKIVIYLILYIASGYLKPDFPVDYNIALPAFYLQIILKSAVTVTIAFIALLAGKLMKSTKATIIASFLLLTLVNGTVGDFTLANNTVFPLVLTGISVLSAAIIVMNAETEDVI